MKVKYLLSFVILAFLITSCSTKKEAKKKVIVPMNTERLMELVNDNRFVFNEILIKTKVNYFDGKKNTDFSGQARMVNDSIIWASASMMGIEGGRGIITYDSIKFFYRPDKTYFAENIMILTNILPEASLQTLQNIIVGNIDIDEEKIISQSIDGDYYKIDVVESFLFRKSIWIEPENFRISRCIISNIITGKIIGRVEYSDYEEVDGKFIPMNMMVSFEKKNENIVATFEYSDVKIDKELSYPFNIPNKYKRLRL